MLTLWGRGACVSEDRQGRSTDVNIEGWGLVSLIDRQARNTDVNIVGGGLCL